MKIKAPEEKTVGGILLPTTAQSKPQGGEVVAVGEGRSVGNVKVDISLKVIGLSTFSVHVYTAAFTCEFNSLIYM